MAKRVDMAKRLEELGHDPVASLVRISREAERIGARNLAAKINLGLTDFIAPKLKSVEHSLDAETRDYLLTAQQRRERILQLQRELRIGQAVEVIEGEIVGELLHTPAPE